MSAARSDKTPRAWQRMLSGRRLNLLDPSPVDVEIEDIAHGLARVARWNGQTSGQHAFSVAEHSMIVEEIASELQPGLEPRWRLAVLLHDAPEYVIGDMISPFKAVMGGAYKTVEDRLQAAIHIRFGLPASLPPAIKKLAKQADIVSAYFEAIELAGFSREDADKIFDRPDRFIALRQSTQKEPESNILLHLKPLPAFEAQEAFLARFRQIEALL